MRFLVEHSAIAFGAARYIERRRSKSGELRRNHEGNALHFTKLEELVRLDEAASRKVYARLEDRLRAFKTVVDRAGAKALLAVCPEQTQVTGEVSPAPIATINKIARRLGFETIDLLAAYRGAGHPVLMKDGTHPNIAGAELIAAKLEAALDRLLGTAPRS